MAKYSAVKATVNAYIKQNGRKEITGKVLNAVLNATIDSLGKYFQFAGGASPTDDPGTPDQNVCYLAGEPGVYTNFGGITIENEEVALLFWDGEWTKQRILIGIREVNASVDNQVGTPSVDVSYSGGELVLTFHNLKGEHGDTGDPAGFGTIGADINGGVGTPGVSVETSGDNTAKNLMFHFTNLKGETGVTSVVATIDDTSGTPSCQVSLEGQQLTLAFSGLKGLKGDTGVSADYPITIYNGLDSDATDQALAAAQGKVLDWKVSQLAQKVTTFNADMTIAVTQGQGANTGSNPAYLAMPMVGGVAYKVILNGDALARITLRPRSADNTPIQTSWKNVSTQQISTADEKAIAAGDEYEIIPSANVERMGIYYAASSAVGSGDVVEIIRTAVPSLEEQIERLSDEIDGLPERVTTLENKVSYITEGLEADEVFNKSVGLPKTDGTIDTSPATRYTSDYIPFTDDITIYNAFTGSASAYAQVQFFDAAKNYLTYRRGTGNATDAELTLLKADYPDAAYIRYGLPSGGSVCHALLSVSVRDYVDKYVSSPNFGASVSLFGASFSAEVSGYYAYVGLNKWRDKLGLKITNYSTPGAGFTSAASSLIQTQVDSACADSVEATDMYIIWASANDFAGQGTIGVNSDYTIDDHYNEEHLNTFCGGLNYCIKKILTKAPTAKIILLTSLRNGHLDAGRNPYSTGSGNNLAKYVDAEKECCYRYGVPYFDQFAMFPMNEFTKDSYLQEDGRHPNAVCYERLADMQIPFLANI